MSTSVVEIALIYGISSSAVNFDYSGSIQVILERYEYPDIRVKLKILEYLGIRIIEIDNTNFKQLLEIIFLSYVIKFIVISK